MYQSMRWYRSGVRQSGAGFIVPATPPYSFPANGLLDSFDRADTGPPPSSNWTGAVVSGDGSFTVTSNEAAPDSAVVSSAWWNVGTLGPNVEVFARAATISGSPFMGLFFRITSPGTASPSGYYVDIDATSGSSPASLRAFRIDSGTFTQLGSSISQNVASGDSLGAKMSGSTITIYFKPSAGSWTALSPTFTDGTYTGAGYIGIRGGNTLSLRWDDFGGGTI